MRDCARAQLKEEGKGLKGEMGKGKSERLSPFTHFPF
jgi:hypothetical protein